MTTTPNAPVPEQLSPAALTTTPQEPPTDDELNALWNCCGDYDEEGDHYGNIFQFARAAIKRWGAK